MRKRWFIVEHQVSKYAAVLALLTEDEESDLSEHSACAEKTSSICTASRR